MVTVVNTPLQISLYELNISEIFEIVWDWPADWLTFTSTFTRISLNSLISQQVDYLNQ
jgi:hypothetical protein